MVSKHSVSFPSLCFLSVHFLFSFVFLSVSFPSIFPFFIYLFCPFYLSFILLISSFFFLFYLSFYSFLILFFLSYFCFVLFLPPSIYQKLFFSSILQKNIHLISTELKTLEWDILNPDRLINLEINNMRRTSII